MLTLLLAWVTALLSGFWGRYPTRPLPWPLQLPLERPISEWAHHFTDFLNLSQLLRLNKPLPQTKKLFYYNDFKGGRNAYRHQCRVLQCVCVCVLGHRVPQKDYKRDTYETSRHRETVLTASDDGSAQAAGDVSEMICVVLVFLSRLQPVMDHRRGLKRTNKKKICTVEKNRHDTQTKINMC